MTDTETHLTPENVAQTVEKIMKDRAKAEPLEPLEKWQINRPAFVSVPDGSTLANIGDELRAAFETMRPIRRKGTARLATLESLIGWANRFQGEDSVLYCDPKDTAPTLTCIANYHAEGGPIPDPDFGDDGAAHGDHRGAYAFPVSKEWKTWTEASGTLMDQADFAAFIGDNVKDLIDPSPALLGTGEPKEEWERRNIELAAKIGGRFGQVHQLIQIAREFEVHEDSRAVIKTNATTGEATMIFESAHKDNDGRPIKIPNLFMIAIPVFDRGTPYRITARFVYRKRGGALMFALVLHDPQSAFNDAVTEAAERAREETALPLFYGTPEA